MTTQPASSHEPPHRDATSSIQGVVVPAAESLSFDANGLLPVIAQQFDSREVLMLAWMDAEAVRRTLETGAMTYYSRSRRTYWVKGETSGHHQRLVELRYDCDQDCLLAVVDQTGPACHTGTRSCFTGRVLPGGPGAPAE